MNEAFDKSGDWPNVAVEAGSDPEEVMSEYGVEPRGLRTAAYEYERTIEQLRAQVSDLTLERDQLSRGLDAEHAMVVQFEHDNEDLREAIDACEMGQMYEMYKAKKRECERLARNLGEERVCRIVAMVTDGLMFGNPRRLFELSCGHSVMLVGLSDKPKYCSYCKAKVVGF